METKRISKQAQLLAALQQGGALTSLQILNRFGIYRAAVPIQRLREAGHQIETTIHRDTLGNQYGSYQLIITRP